MDIESIEYLENRITFLQNVLRRLSYSVPPYKTETETERKEYLRKYITQLHAIFDSML